MASMDDVGKVIVVTDSAHDLPVRDVEVIMTIRSSKGLLVLFDRPEKSQLMRYKHQIAQVKAIKGFMEATSEKTG